MAKHKYPEFESMEALPYTPVPHPDRTGPGATMTKQEFCRTFGIARYDLDRAIENGGPVLKRGTQFEPWQVPAGDMLRWMIEDKAKTAADPDLSPLRRNQIKLILSQVEKLELKNAATRRELVTIDEAVTLYREEADVIRRHLRSLPDAVATALGALAESDPIGRKDSAVVAMVVQDVINDTLRSIFEEDSYVQAA
ncbi:terminase small subunit [Bradyrhizobium daqingense]|uniref:Phage terminase Nu1 subunit (DNA packaging protein) n=1 Tax=Bradyrhizobium daqingense TaxID=993502 RepID=A0A562L4B5_9BRAD|nr:terminase small subunit [Bradyrhizobium daqingense]TWI02471.1 hypothetical protein IQ17_04084 [Bradyrhizobium daqingense]UFS90937.1 terminase small subunit [Bradyrhizobium daqingense]